MCSIGVVEEFAARLTRSELPGNERLEALPTAPPEAEPLQSRTQVLPEYQETSYPLALSGAISCL